MRTTPRVAGFRSEYPAGFELECMAGFVGIRILRGRLFRERPRQHEFGLEDSAGFLDQSIQRGGHPGDRPVNDISLDIAELVA